MFFDFFFLNSDTVPKGNVTRDDLQRRFLAQHIVVTLEQCCKHSKQCRNQIATLGCTKNRRCESSRLTLINLECNFRKIIL